MNEKIVERCDLLAENRKKISDSFVWTSDYLKLPAAALFTTLGKEADIDALKENEKLLKKNTGFFSELRGNIKITLLTKMTLTSDPEKYLNDVKDIYEKLSSGIFGKSEYKVLSAMIVADSGKQADEMIERILYLYKDMKVKHSFLTSTEDYPLCAVLAVSGRKIDDVIEDMDVSFKLLKEKFSDQNAVQTLSHVLSLYSEAADVKCRKVIDIFDEFDRTGHKYGKGFELANLGVFQSLDFPVQKLVETANEADECLKEKKGFGDMTLGAKLRRLYAVQIAIDILAEGSTETNTVCMGAMLATAIQMEILMMVLMMTAVSASTTAASSH